MGIGPGRVHRAILAALSSIDEADDGLPYGDLAAIVYGPDCIESQRGSLARVIRLRAQRGEVSTRWTHGAVSALAGWWPTDLSINDLILASRIGPCRLSKPSHVALRHKEIAQHLC